MIVEACDNCKKLNTELRVLSFRQYFNNGFKSPSAFSVDSKLESSVNAMLDFKRMCLNCITKRIFELLHTL